MARGMTIKARIGVTVAGIFLATALATLVLSYQWMNRLLQEDLRELAHTQELQFETLLQGEFDGLVRGQIGLGRLEELLAPLARRDREALWAAAQPLFLEMKANNAVANLSFLNPDGTVFLRMHRPKERGDLITRATFLKAQATGRTATGLELGRHSFSLRCIRPLLYRGALIGYLEIDEALDHIFDCLKHLTGNEVSLLLSKEFLKKEGSHVGGRTVGDFSLLTGTDTAGTLFLAKQMAQTLPQGLRAAGVSMVELQGREQAVVLMPVRDSGGRSIGMLLSHSDISARYREIRRSAAAITATGSAIMLLALCVLALTLRRSLYLFHGLKLQIEEVTTEWDLSGRLEVATDDEIGSVAASFNLMLEQLERQQDDLKSQVEALAESEAMLRNLVDSMPVGVWWYDSQGRIQYLNRYFQERLGYTLADIPTVEEWFRLAYPDPELRQSYRARRDAALQEALSLGTPLQPRENKVTGKDGAVRHVVISDLVEKTRVVVILTDITEHEFINSQLLKVQKMESLGVLAGGIAHDFNNILTGVMGNISFAEMFLEPSHKSRAPLAMAEKACLRAAGLARQLLTFAKGGEPIKKALSPRHLLEESVSLMLRGSNVKGTLDLPRDLSYIEADENQLSQAFSNLVLNAVQAMPQGGELTVTGGNVRLDEGNRQGVPAGEYVRIIFRDEGGGISPEDQKKIFDPYFTTKATGTGLGLASVHSIVSRHGGSIEVASRDGRGSSFTLHLRACPPPAAAQCLWEPGVVPVPAGGARVLVMDDEEMIRKLAGEMLEYLGYRVVTCASGDEAVRLYREALESGAPFAAAIMDLTVPGAMGGEEAAEAILKFHPEARLIVSSGYSEDPVMAHYAGYGFRGAVLKPYQVNDLVSVLNDVVAGVVPAPEGDGSAA